MKEIRKPRVKLSKIGSFHASGEWVTFFGDSKGRVYQRKKRRGLKETWWFTTRVFVRQPEGMERS